MQQAKNVGKTPLLDFMQNNAVVVCYGISTLIVALLFTGVFYKSIEEKKLEVSQIYRDTSNISRAVEEHAIRTFEQASLLALSIRSRLEQDDKLDLNTLAQVDPRAMSIFQQLAIINEKGIVSGSSIPGFAPVDLSEREHFKVHAQSPDVGLFVSKPVLGKVSNKWSIQLTTRLARADKSFAGVVVVSLDPFYLSSFYKDIDIGPHGSIILVGRDGVIRAQKNMDDTTVGKKLDDAMVRYLENNQWQQADYEYQDPASGRVMFCTFRSVKGFPLSVLISIAEEDALEGYYARRSEYFIFAASLSVLVYLLAAWMTGIFKALRENAQRQRVTFENSPLGILHLAPDGTVLNCNDKFAEQMGAPRVDIIGFDAALHSGDEVRERIRKALAGKAGEFEGLYTSHKGGKTSYLRMIFNPVYVEAGASEVIVTSEDVSERKAAEQALQKAYAEIEQRVTERTRELARANELLQGEIIERKLAHREINQILSSISSLLIGVDKGGRVVRWNDAAENCLGLAAPALLGRPFETLPIPWDRQPLMAGVARTRQELTPQRLYNVWYERLDGGDGFFAVTVSPLRNDDGGYDGFLILADDISEVKLLEAKLAHAGKLEAIGQLAAGIAHEINTPTQFVGDSVTFLKGVYDDLNRVIALAQGLAAGGGNECSTTAEAVGRILEDIDIAFIEEETPKTFKRIFDGIERISTIVQAMRRFSHSGGEGMKAVDLREAIENTLVISRPEWKYVATVETSFDPELSDVVCNPGEINQVLLNIVVNAAHAIGDVVGEGEQGLISVSTRRDGDFAEIRVRDTGGGIPPEARDRVFEMFFTTKDVGKGSGQGLAIAYDIVVNKHKGSITFDTESGQGTTFIIRLPLS